MPTDGGFIILGTNKIYFDFNFYQRMLKVCNKELEKKQH